MKLEKRGTFILDDFKGTPSPSTKGKTGVALGVRLVHHKKIYLPEIGEVSFALFWSFGSCPLSSMARHASPAFHALRDH